MVKNLFPQAFLSEEEEKENIFILAFSVITAAANNNTF